jgi:RNA polymerase primary sigma factor
MSLDYVAANSSVDQYLREIGVYPLLSAEEEMTMALRAQVGDPEARLTMVQSNLRLVVKIALEYTGLGLPLPDLISEGNIGLMRAAELFDPAKETKFSTYSALWIKQRIRRAITNQGKTIRVPIWKNQLLRRLKITTERMATQLGRQPTELEISDGSGLSPSDILKLQDGSVQISSLDAPLGREEDSETTLGSLLQDETVSRPGDTLARQELLMETVASLDMLDDKELKIIALRFGFDGKGEQTLDSIGKNFRVSRERIRQLQELILVKLRKKFHKEVSRLPERHRDRAVRNVLERLKNQFNFPAKKMAFLSGMEPLLTVASFHGL